MKGATLGLINAGFLFSVFATVSLSHAAVSLDDVLNSQRSIVQHDAKQESAHVSMAQNRVRISGLQDKISGVYLSLSDIKKDITRNEKGMSDFPEMVSHFQPKISALITSKAKLLGQRKEYLQSIKTLQDEINDLSIEADERQIESAKQSRRLKKLKQSYLDRQVSQTINKAEKGQLVIETQQLTCSFSDIFGKHEGDKSVCTRLAVEQAKRSAAEKYSPTNITSELKSHNFEITSESSSQYYAVDVAIVKEFKGESWLKMEPEAERYRAQFKGEIRITPAFTNKTRQKLMERFAVQLAGEVGQVAANEKSKSIAASKRIERKEEAKADESSANAGFEALRRETELLKKANDAHQIEQQQQASVRAEQKHDIDRQALEARAKAEMQRRIQAEVRLLEKQAKNTEEKEKEVFVPPVF